MAGMSRRWIPAACVISVYAVSLILFRINGGFGGGHGHYDLPVAILALPWSLLEGVLPSSMLSAMNDLCLFIVLPFVLNMAAVYVVLFLYRVVRERMRTRGSG